MQIVHRRLARWSGSCLVALVVIVDMVSAQSVRVVSTTPAGVTGNSSSGGPVISADGSTAVFTSNASDLIPDDTNAVADVFAVDLASGAIERISVGTGGVQSNEYSEPAGVSADGRIVSFRSQATNLVAGVGLPLHTYVYVRDRDAGVTTAASNSPATGGALSADGRYVVFQVYESVMHVYRHDRQTGALDEVSRSFSGGTPDNDSFVNTREALSADGRFVVFDSWATNLVPGYVPHASHGDVYLRDMQAGTTSLLALTPAGQPANDVSRFACLSADGQVAAFVSSATNLAPGGLAAFDDVYVRNLQTGAVRWASHGSLGAPNNGGISRLALSADGRWLAMEGGGATALIPPGVFPPPNFQFGAFVHDTATGLTWLTGMNPSGFPVVMSASASLSGDGRLAGFETTAPLLPADENGFLDSYVWDRLTGSAWTDLGAALGGAHGSPALGGQGTTLANKPVVLALGNALEGAPAFLVIGTALANLPFKGGTLLPAPLAIVPLVVASDGRIAFVAKWPAGLPAGAVILFQYWIKDNAGPHAFAASNGVAAAQS